MGCVSGDGGHARELRRRIMYGVRRNDSVFTDYFALHKQYSELTIVLHKQQRRIIIKNKRRIKIVTIMKTIEKIKK